MKMVGRSRYWGTGCEGEDRIIKNKRATMNVVCKFEELKMRVCEG